MNDTYNDGYKTEDIKCIIVDFIPEDGKGGFPIMRQGIYVLCKDCKYWDYEVDNDVGFCTRTEDCDWNADDFCSRGKRK